MTMIESLYNAYPSGQQRHMPGQQMGGNLSSGSPTMDYPQDVNEEDENKFYVMVGSQVEQAVKLFEWKLDSVRKERESVIVMIENIVKQIFDKNQQHTSRAKNQAVIVPVGIKQYGSQASFLAVDSSDVDLAVTGLKIGGDKGSQLKEMRRLFTELFSLKPQGYISHIEIIE